MSPRRSMRSAVPRIVPFSDHADDLVAVHHNQRPNVFFSHLRDGVIDRGVRVNRASFPTFLVEQLSHGGHLDPASATPPGKILITIHQIRRKALIRIKPTLPR